MPISNLLLWVGRVNVMATTTLELLLQEEMVGSNHVMESAVTRC